MRTPTSEERFSDLCLLFSGGTDSFIAYHYVIKDGATTDLVNFPIRNRYCGAEREACTRTIDALLKSSPANTVKFYKIAWFEWLGMIEEEDGNIPARNLHLILGAASLGYNRIILVVQEDEMSVPDRTGMFLTNCSTLCSQLFGRRVAVITPFAHMDKTDMVAWYLKTRLPLKGLLDTFSCLKPVEDASRIVADLDPITGHVSNARQDPWIPCGDCPACFRRAVSFELNGILNPGHFAQHPLRSSTAEAYLVIAREGKKYSKKRNGRIIEAMESR